jgi:oxygen-independent coproporphyrinogen-3 oxidase
MRQLLSYGSHVKLKEHKAMKLCLKNHDYKYAAEQMLLTLFPSERPVYGDAEEENTAQLYLSRGAVWATGKTVLRYRGETHTAACRVKTADLCEGPELDRVLQKALKLSFYRAGIRALGKEPPWGALTGVRPVKIPTKILLAGGTPAEGEAVLRDTYHVTPLRRRLAMDCAKASVSANRSLREDEISLYVGIPFCPTRCAYCSFVSADVGRTLKLVEPYLAALFQEIAAAGQGIRAAGLAVRTVYIGGGTPTTLSAQQLSALMETIAKHIDLSRCSEYTVEAGRPDTITADKLAAMKGGGADRVSVNPQTMHDHVLSAMGRNHSAADTLEAYQLVRESGLACVNMDLIAGLPKDSPEGFRTSLDRVLALRPENLTVHTLALKKGSRLLNEGGSIPSDCDVAQMLDYAWDTLRREGYAPYYLYRQKYMSGSFENVGWTLPGCENLYNIAMMEELHTVLALGGGGVTKLVDTAQGKIKRLADPKYPYEYIANIGKIAQEKAGLAEIYAQMHI